MTVSAPSARLVDRCLTRLLVVAAILTGLAAVSWPRDVAADQATDRLTSRPRPPAPAVKELAVGEELQTKAGERRRVRLPDGSILYVNAATRATLETPRRLSVAAGEVYVEAAARERELDAPLVVRTPNREVVGQ